MNKYISASVMCADQMNLATQIKELEKAGIDYLHVDIMDGHFVPNITLGFDFVKDLKKITDIPLDVHMMVENPSAFLDYLPLEKDDILCVHYESEVHIHRTLEQINKMGCRTGLALNPATPLECAKYLTDYIDMLLVMTVSPGFAGQKLFAAAERKTLEARKMLEESSRNRILIEVDGNISIPNAQKLNKCGADIFVLGTSSLFLKDKPLFDAAVDFRTALGEE